MLMRECSDAVRLAKAFLARGEWGREARWAAERALLISWHRLGVEVVLIEHALILSSPEICPALFRGRGEQIDCVARNSKPPSPRPSQHQPKTHYPSIQTEWKEALKC
jgi:hypothetical protein